MSTVTFPTLRLLLEFSDLDGNLYAILFDLCERFWPDGAKPARIVCIHRSPEEEKAAGGVSGIHTIGPPHRAIDIGGKEFTQMQLDTAAMGINRLWQYDAARPEKLVCSVQPHGTGPHFHLQVHANTTRSGGSP